MIKVYAIQRNRLCPYQKRAYKIIPTIFVESPINTVVGKRFGKRQQMQWSKPGAHLLLGERQKVGAFRRRMFHFRSPCQRHGEMSRFRQDKMSHFLHRLCEKSATAGELASGSPWRLVKYVMAHITGEDRSQLLLLPDAVDGYVGPDNPVRFILMHSQAASTLRRLDSSGFGPTTRAVPGYDPGDLLKLYIYGYLNRIRSSPQAGSGDASQPRGDLAATPTEARLQDDRGLPARQSQCVPGGVSAVRAVVP